MLASLLVSQIIVFHTGAFCPQCMQDLNDMKTVYLSHANHTSGAQWLHVAVATILSSWATSGGTAD